MAFLNPSSKMKESYTIVHKIGNFLLNITYLKTDKYDHLCFKISRFEVSNHQFPFIRFLYIDTDSLRFHEGPEGIFVDLISIVNLLRTIGVDFREEFSFRDIKRTQKYSNAILSNIE